MPASRYFHDNIQMRFFLHFLHLNPLQLEQTKKKKKFNRVPNEKECSSLSQFCFPKPASLWNRLSTWILSWTLCTWNLFKSQDSIVIYRLMPKVPSPLFLFIIHTSLVVIILNIRIYLNGSRASYWVKFYIKKISNNLAFKQTHQFQSCFFFLIL